MKIKGFIEISLVDWQNKVSSVIFLPNCNFRCPFCHNVDLVIRPETIKTIPFEQIKNYLVKHKEWIDGVCISGGEPTLHIELPQLCLKLKELDIQIKLDTNGTNPIMLKELIDKKLIDYVAMDIKAPLTKDKYSKACGINIVNKLFKNVKESIKILMESNIDYEFRTTVVPTIHEPSDIEQIRESLKGCKKYVLQKFDIVGKEILSSDLQTKFGSILVAETRN